MSAHGVGPSLDYNAGPQSQPPTTRTTPDSGLGGDERGMQRPPPHLYYQQNQPGHPSQQVYQMAGHLEQQQQLGYFAQDSYKRQMNNGTTYFVGENGQHIPQEVYNRMQMARGQPPMQPYQQDQQDSAYSHSSTPSQSTMNPAMMNGPPIQMTPNGPMMMSQNGQTNYYYDGIPPNGGVATPRQPNQSYDSGEMAPPHQQQQQFVAPPQNFHQPPPNLYQQQHPAQYANGHPIQQPAGPPHMVRATLMMQRKNEQLQYAQQQGYPPQMVPQMVNPQVYMMPPYIRNPNHPAMRAPHDQQQFVPSGVMASQYYAFHPPNIAQQMMQPQFFQQQSPFGYQIYRGGQFKKGSYGRSSGRGMTVTSQISHFPIDRFIPGTVAAEVRPETAPPIISQESTSPQIKELTNTLTQLEIAPEPMPPKDLQSIQLLQIAAVQPEEEEERSEPEEPKEIPPPAAEILKEPTPEVIPVEAEPPKPAESAAPTRVCQYCKTQNKPVEEYTNHVLKENQKVVCPDALLTMACSFCGQVGGEDAHTIVSCPRKKRGEKSVPQTPQRDPSRESVRSNAQREELRQDVRQSQRGGGGYQQKQGGYRDGERFQQRDGYKKNYRGGRGQSRGGYSDTGRGRTFNQTSRQQSAQN